MHVSCSYCSRPPLAGLHWIESVHSEGSMLHIIASLPEQLRFTTFGRWSLFAFQNKNVAFAVSCAPCVAALTLHALLSGSSCLVQLSRAGALVRGVGTMTKMLEEDALKIDFTTDSLDQPDPFGCKAVVPDDVVEAIRRVGVTGSLIVLLAAPALQVVRYPQRQGCHL